MRKPDCLFCKIVAGEIPCQKVFESDTVLGFKDIKPIAPIHYLFIPKDHSDSLADLKNVNLLSDVYQALIEVAHKEGLSERGFRTVINNGSEGGQVVFHLHVHLLGGRKLSGRID